MPLYRRPKPSYLAVCATLSLSLGLLTSPSGMAAELSLKSATAAIEAVGHEPAFHPDRVAISIVDAGGHLLYFTRPASVPSGMGDAATKKARTAAAYGMDTKVLEDAVQQGNTTYLGLPGILALRGGLPVLAQGRLQGAIGVAGANSDDDAALAGAILQALAR
ncbi:heme-binding protein [Pseudomonas gingeri]|uniref:GlcG/HbpS family heme-binding protein n=1 Tax=Pseudomonas gingeri TaxID=117681 RepID=UPI00159FBB09|nr:heme-binding protein [Pseudomonas gingeri]NVZ63029.1 heme-binding protein [Pseudomonas gingeri]NVZ78956.1 heme-binding protein [Pseudomonas gingeri]